MDDRIHRYLSLLRKRITADRVVRADLDTDLAALALTMTPQEITACWAGERGVSKAADTRLADLVIVTKNEAVIAMVQRAVPYPSACAVETIDDPHVILEERHPKMLIIDDVCLREDDLRRLAQAMRAKGSRIPVLVLATCARHLMDCRTFGFCAFAEKDATAPLLLGVIVHSLMAVNTEPEGRIVAA